MKFYVEEILALAAFVAFMVFSNGAEAQDVLKDKRPVAQGNCVFKDGKFQLFAQNLVAPQDVFEVKPCVLFAADPSLNPTWIAILDEEGVQEVLEWRDPYTVTSVYKRLKGGI